MSFSTKPLYHPSKKTVELFIYISSKLKGRSNYGSTLLNKCMYFIDCMSYLRTGHCITDFNYIKQEFGPTPEPAKFLYVREALVTKDDVEVKEVDCFNGRTQKRYIAKREPNIEVFDKSEIFLIDEVIETLRDYSATEASDYSHDLIAWKFSEDKEELPFYTFLLSRKEPDLADYEWANKSMKAYLDKTNSANGSGSKDKI